MKHQKEKKRIILSSTRFSGDSGTGPKAYLNYIVFDRNFVYKTGGFKRLSTASKENGSDVPHERLFFEGAEQIVITEPGYVYIYLSNENDTPVEVYFDDFKVTHTRSPVIQMIDYYPFGLTSNSFTRENSTPNNYLYNGKELQDELNLGWYDYQARQYDPALGRWMAPDPLSDLSRRWSPYTYCYNNPLLFVDPDGMFGDFYDQKGNKVGTDGQDDGKVYVVTDKKEAKTISETDKTGGKTQVDQVNSEVELPSAFVRGEMGKAVDRSNSRNDTRTDEFKGDDDEGGFHEEGGLYGTTFSGKESVVHAKPGAKADPMDAGMATVAPSDPADPSKDNLEVQSGSFHVHPSGTRTPGLNTIGSSGSFTQSPTAPQDYNEAKGYSGNSYVLGAGNGTVYIYNGNSSKPTATFPLKQFRSIGN